ncbi:MAG: hypothetical protein ACXAAH_02500 [Promethearchaeota archaeon]|jgi:hypothetical protein
MEVLQNVTSIEILTNKISYNKKTNILSVGILDFMFVGIYKKSARVSTILDDIFASLGEVNFGREDIHFLDANTHIKIHGNTKVKNLKLSAKKKTEKKKGKKAKPQKITDFEKKDTYEIEEDYDDEVSTLSSISDDIQYKEEEFEEELYEEEPALRRDEREKQVRKEKKESVKMKKRSMPPPSPAPGAGPMRKPAELAESKSAPAAPPPPSDAYAGARATEPAKPTISTSEVEIPQPTVYDINMGLQYYSVMMEQRSYLFYVYFSHEELKIVDEEGKTIYKTTVQVVTTKKEPPVLDLKIEGEEFEVHPIFGKVEVKKDFVNPPVMIFSLMPLKSVKKKRKKKEMERRFLNVYIEFEEKVISHTILSIIVQPKFFRLDIGPLHLNLSKKTAIIISFISILIAGISLVYMLLSVDPSSTFTDYLSGLAPGLGSIIFIVIFLYTLLKEGIYPLKEKISAFLNFDQTGVLIK